jgi:large subunit ribosomal protein L46
VTPGNFFSIGETQRHKFTITAIQESGDGHTIQWGAAHGVATAYVMVPIDPQQCPLTPNAGPSIVDTGVCRSCQQTLGRRQYAATTETSSTETASIAKDASASTSFPVVKPVYTINAGIALSRPPQVTRELEPFEKAYYLYQKRLNERLALPFTKYFYFKRGTPADEDWKRKILDRRTAARDIGKYNAYASDAWNDELLVGAPEAEPEHQIEMLVQDAESTANATSQDTSKKEEIPRPFPRVTEADKKGDEKSLDRLLPRTLYLLVQAKGGYWKLPSAPVEAGESLRLVSLLPFPCWGEKMLIISGF